MARVFADASAAKLISAVQRLTNDPVFSVAFRIMRTATPIAARSVITAADAVATPGFVIEMTTTNLLGCIVPYATTDKRRNSTTAPTLNVWQHVCITHSNAGLTSADILFYFDGKQEAGTNVASGSGAHDTATAVAVEIGASTAHGATAAPMNIASVGFWNRVLSPAEAMALATGAHPLRFKEGLIEYWDLDGSSYEEGCLAKLVLIQGATNPTNAAVKPALESVPFLFETRPNTAPRSRARARYMANAAAAATLTRRTLHPFGNHAGGRVMR